MPRRVSLSRLSAGPLLALLAGAVPFAGKTAAQAAPFPQAAARAYLSAAAPPAAAEATLRRLAAGSGSGAGTENRALAAFALGTGEAARGQLDAAAEDLALAQAWAPARDAATAALAALEARRNDAAATLAAAAQYPLDAAGPFYALIAMDAARATAALGQYPEVTRWTEGLPATAPVVALRAAAVEADGDPRAAAALYRDLVYRFPSSAEAAAGAAGWQRLGPGYPDLAPDAALLAAQAAAWSRAGRPRDAAASWAEAAALAPAAGQPALRADQARALLAAGNPTAAAALMARLLDSPERAQGLELDIELARAQPAPAAVTVVATAGTAASSAAGGPPAAVAIDARLAELAAEFPSSPWYARGLHEGGDEALLRADAGRAQADFDILVERFPDSAYAPQAMWQAAWIAYRLGQPETPQRLEMYLLRYPQSGAAADALYWRGRWAESHAESGLAQQCYRTAARRFPGTYFGLQARARINAAAVGTTAAFLRPFLALPPTPRATAAPAAWQPELARAQALRQAWLLEPAATILSAALAAQPPGGAALGVARRLAQVDQQRAASPWPADPEAWYAALAALARAVPNYLQLGAAQLPAADWASLFPHPFAPAIDAVAARDGIAPELLLGLIRQESAFNPQSLSSARARGLMQLELATARIHFPRLAPEWRRLAPPGELQSESLFIPALNIALGAAELRTLLDRFHEPALALAGYDAGTSRVLLWQRLFSYPGADADVNEFIESIPFAETRGYVQAVLRNEAHYARVRR